MSTVIDNVGESVRKIRSFSEVKMLVEAALQRPDGITLEEIRRKLYDMRLNREGERLRATQRYGKNTSARSSPKALEALSRDFISFANVVGLFQSSEGRYFPTDLARNLWDTFETKEEKIGRREVIGLLFSPHYPAYYNFVRSLIRNRGEFRLSPIIASRRNPSEFKKYLRALGIMSDPASFLTLKDLYYDFEILNWFRDESDKTEHIYLTNELDSFEDLLQSEDFEIYKTLHLRKVDAGRIWQELLTIYSRSGEIGAYSNLITLRDKVCATLRISDRFFARAFSHVKDLESKDGYEIALGST